MIKILIIVTMTNSFGESGFYNSQEIGLGEAFAELGHNVIIYKSIRSGIDRHELLRERLVIKYSACWHIGANGLVNPQAFDKDADLLIQFADTQLSVPWVYRWCKNNKVIYLPYIGVTYSQSSNAIGRLLMTWAYGRNRRIFRRCICAAKNECVLRSLCQEGIKQAQLAPVCLNVNLLNDDYSQANKAELRKQWGFGIDDRVILYVGRFDVDKQPLRILHNIKILYEQDCHIKLLMVGKGKLYLDAQKYVHDYDMDNYVKLVPPIPNKDIWACYVSSNYFVNLCDVEIFGMALLEAMFYEVEVVAIPAPGPLTIITNNETGHLVETDEELRAQLLAQNNETIIQAAHDRIVERFIWINTAKIMIEIYAASTAVSRLQL